MTIDECKDTARKNFRDYILGPTGLTLGMIIPHDGDLTCSITGCGKSACAFYSHGMLCEFHEKKAGEEIQRITYLNRVAVR